MKMTEKLANSIMENLACLAISANGGVPVDENGNPMITDEQMEAINEYVEITFLDLCNDWEMATGKKWEIILDDECED